MNFEFYDSKFFFLKKGVRSHFDQENKKKRIFSSSKNFFRLAERHWVVSLVSQIYQIKFTENLSKKDLNSLLWLLVSHKK